MTALQAAYEERFNRMLQPLAQKLQVYLLNTLGNHKRIDRISVRPKSIDRFIAKATKQINGEAKYRDPLNQIQDQIGARIVTYYKTDVDQIAGEVTKSFRHIESQIIVPESESEFGYEGQHFILFLPRDIFDGAIHENESISFFELQIKTLFQHAWSEAEHDLGYKPTTELTKEHKRRLAFTAAQAWGADQIFDELHRQLGQAG
jgi:putative GTP pyrophosphokinase